jgi:hypothetical protein
VTKPDETFITQYKTHLSEVWSEAHAHWRGVIDPWYWQKVNPWPAGSQRPYVIPSTARNIIEHATDTQLAFEPKFSRNPVGAGMQHEQDADAIEAGLHAVFVDAMLREPVLAFKQLGKNLGMYGYGVAKGPVLDLRDRPKKPVQRKGEKDELFRWREVDYKNSRRSWNPIRITAPHPSTVLLDPLKKQPDDGIEFRKMYTGHITDLLASLRERKRKTLYVATEGSLPLGSGDNPFTTVDAIEYWSREYHALVVGSQMAFLEDNVYGFCPFNHAFTGFGQDLTSQDAINPYYMAQGLLDSILPSLKVQAQSFSAKHTVLLERAYPRKWARNPEEVSEALATPDGILPLDAKEDYGFVVYPEVERGLAEIDRRIDEDIEMGTFTRAVAGMRQQGVSTVGQQAILSTAATKKFAVVNKHLNLMATIIGMNTLRLIDRLGEAIEVAGERLDPKQIHNDYNVIAEFHTYDPIIQQAERELGLREVEAEVISDETYRERTQIADESKEKKRLIAQKVRSGPAYEQAMSKVIADEDGMTDIIEGLNDPDELPAGAAVPASPTGPQGSPGTLAGATESMRRPLTPDVRQPPQMGAA